jgi:hypothetical protein
MTIEIVHCPTWHGNQVKAASFAAAIKQRLGVEPILIPGKTGQFDVVVDGEKISERGGNMLTRMFGAGYPDLDSVVEQIEKHRPGGTAWLTRLPSIESIRPWYPSAMPRIKPCRCDHAKTIHRAKPGVKKLMGRCWFPDCKCKVYKPKG